MRIKTVFNILLPFVAIAALMALIWGFTTIGTDGVKVVIVTTPAQASARINENFVGTTPVTLDGMGEGTYIIRLTKFGHQSVLKQVRFRPGLNEFTFDLPESMGGTLKIESTPAKADIIIDGETRGKTPATIAGLAPGGPYSQTAAGELPRLDRNLQHRPVRPGKPVPHTDGANRGKLPCSNKGQSRQDRKLRGPRTLLHRAQ